MLKTSYHNDTKFSDKFLSGHSVDQDQTAPSGAV